MIRRLVLFLFCLAFLASAARAATDTINQRASDGSVVGFNAVKVVGLERAGGATSFLALDYRGRTGRFDAASVVSVAFAPDRRFRLATEDGGQHPAAVLSSYADGNLVAVLQDGAAPSTIPLASIVAMQGHDVAPPTVEETMAATNAALDMMAGTGPAQAAPAEAQVDIDAADASPAPQGTRNGRKTMLFAVGGGALGLALLAGLVRMLRGS